MQSSIAETVTICTNKYLIGRSKNLQHWFSVLGLTSWLAKHPEGDPQNTFQSYRVRLPEACLARAVSLCWLQAVPGEAAEMKYWQEAERSLLSFCVVCSKQCMAGFSTARREGSACQQLHC